MILTDLKCPSKLQDKNTQRTELHRNYKKIVRGVLKLYTSDSTT